MRQSLRILSAGLLLLPLTACSAVKHRKELGVLVDLGKDEERKKEILDAETKAFNKCKEAVLEGKLYPGMGTKEISSKVGDPVIKVDAADGMKWSYKTGSGNWFKDELIHLYFNKENQLVRSECIRFECPVSS